MDAFARCIPPDALRIERRGWIVRPYASGDEHGILELHHAVWPPPLGKRRTLAEWHWQYRDAPLGHRIVLGQDSAGQIIAHYATIPLRVWQDGRVVVGCVGVDSMVHPNARHDGLFVTTGLAYYEAWGGQAPNAWNWGFANQQAQRIGTNRLGYLTIEDGIPALYLNRFDADQRLQPAAQSLQVQRVARFALDVDQLWQRCCASYPFAVIRDHAYLTWRFVDSPVRPLCLEVRDAKQLRGIAVLQANWTQQPIVAVVEYFADPQDVACLAAVLEHAAAFAAEHQQIRVELWLPPRSPMFAQALALGMRSEFTGCRLICRPTREMTNPAAWCQRWHYTIGDSDIS